MRNRSVVSFLGVFVVALQLAFALPAFADGEAITPEQGKAMIAEKQDLVILDVRNPNEVVVASYPGSINIPVKELENRAGEIPAGKPVLIHCAKGKRAERAYATLKEQRPDITEVYYIAGEPIF